MVNALSAAETAMLMAIGIPVGLMAVAVVSSLWERYKR